MAVAYARAGRHVPNLDHPGGKTHHGPHGIFRRRCRVDAVEGRTRTGEVEMEGPAEEYSRGVRERSRGWRQHRTKSVELAQLRLVCWMPRLVGTGEMAHDQLDPQAFEARPVVCDRGDVA